MMQPRDENFFDAEDAQLNEQIAKEEKLERMKRLDDLRWVLSTVKGRRLIWWLLSLCGIFRASYAPKDSNQTAFNEGNRDIGLRLLREVHGANPKAYSQMEDEVLSEIGKRNKKGAQDV